MSEKTKKNTPFGGIVSIVKGFERFTSNSIATMTFNFVNSVIGSGILFFPYTISKLGLAVGLSYMLWGCFVINFCQTIGFIACKKTIEKEGNKFPTLESYVRHHFGTVTYYITKVLVIIMCMTFLLIYGIVMIDLLCSVFGVTKDDPRRYIIACVIFFAENILSMVEKIRDFKLISYVSCTSAIIFICTGFVLYFTGNVSPMGKVKILPDRTGFALIYDTLLFNGVCIYPFFNLLYFTTSNETKRTEQYKVVVGMAFSAVICFICNYSCALVGYFSFLEDTNPNVVLNYKGKLIGIILRLLIFFSVFLSFPLFNYVNAIALDELVLDIYDVIVSKTKAKELKKKEKKKKGGYNEASCIPAERPKLSFNLIPKFLREKCVSPAEAETPLLDDSEFTSEDEQYGSVNPESSEEDDSVVVEEEKDVSIKKGDDKKKKVVAEIKPTGKQRLIRFFRLMIINTLHNVMTLLVVLFFPYFLVIMGFSGAIFGTLFGVVLPWSLYIKACAKTIAMKILCVVVMLVFVVLVGIAPLGVQIWEYYYGDKI